MKGLFNNVKEFIVNIKNKKVANVQEVRNIFAQLKDGEYFVTVKDYRKRSLSQNAYYWKVCVEYVRRGLYDIGYDEAGTLKPEEVHEIIKTALLPAKRIVNKQTGEILELPGSTTELSIVGFNEFLEAVIKWAAEYLSVSIPSPNEQLVIFDEYASDLNK